MTNDTTTLAPSVELVSEEFRIAPTPAGTKGLPEEIFIQTDEDVIAD